MRRLLALMAALAVLSVVAWCECWEHRREAARLRAIVQEMTVREVEGDVAHQQWAASVLAARARVAIRALRKAAEDESQPEVVAHCRELLQRIEEELR